MPIRPLGLAVRSEPSERLGSVLTLEHRPAPMNHRAKSPTPGLRPAFASPSQRSVARGLSPKLASPDSTASQRSVARGLGSKSAAQSTAPVTLETVMVEVLGKIEILLGQARARIAAHDAAKSASVADTKPLPSLTSAFATRRAVFGAFDGEDLDG